MSNVIKLKHDAKRFSVKIKDSGSTNIFEEHEDLVEKERLLNEQRFQERYDKGFQVGKDSQKKELEDNYKAKLLLRYEELNKTFGQVEVNIEEYGKSFTDLVIDLSTKIAEKIVRREIKKESTANKVIRESLSRIIGANSVKVKMNPNELKEIRSESDGILSDESFNHVKFEADERIDAGGCLVVTEIGNVDGRITTQLAEITKQLNTFYSDADG